MQDSTSRLNDDPSKLAPEARPAKTRTVGATSRSVESRSQTTKRSLRYGDKVLYNGYEIWKPDMVLAGLGELSRIGELVLNPFLGPRHKTAIITTDLPLAVDKPIDFGLQDFCGKCRKCARECPAQAIPYGDKVLYNGYEIWKPDVGKCNDYVELYIIVVLPRVGGLHHRYEWREAA